MKCLILAAGYGTRLLPITENIPKCLININDSPIIQIWVLKIYDINIHDIFINTHYLHQEVNNFFQNTDLPLKVNLLYESKLLGTAGTLIENIELFENDNLLLLHADNYTDDDLSALIKAHQERPKCCLMTMMLFNTDDPLNSGIVETENNIVINFYEKCTKDKGTLANAAIYILSPEMLSDIKNKYNECEDFVTEILPNFLGRIYTYKTSFYFEDIGSIHKLNKTIEHVHKNNKKV